MTTGVGLGILVGCGVGVKTSKLLGGVDVGAFNGDIGGIGGTWVARFCCKGDLGMGKIERGDVKLCWLIAGWTA